MSNVIIGIIGVILFIGLAIAGTTILGRDFMTAGSSSVAAVVSSHLQQIAQAAQAQKARRGTIIASSTADYPGALVSLGALKAVPVNPLRPGNVYDVTSAAFGKDSSEAAFVYTQLGPQNDQRAHDACLAIEETVGSANPAARVDAAVDPVASAQANRRLGCLSATTFGGAYVAYAPI